MSEPEVQKSEGINLLDNPAEWLDAKARDAEPEEPTGQSEPPASPAEPTVAEPDVAAQPAGVNWREVVLPDDVPHGFFKGKKVEVLFESYTHAEKAKQEAERQRNEALRELDQLRREREAEAAVRRVTGVQPQANEPQGDPLDAEIQAAWFEDPAKARRLMQEQNAREAQRIAQEEWQRAEYSRQEAYRQRAAQDAANAAVQRVAQMYGVSEEQAKARVMGAFTPMAAHVQSSNDPDVWLNPDAYINTVRWMVGDPTPQAAPTIPTTPVPELSDPPGSKRPTPTTAPRGSEASPLSREAEQTYRALAEATGIDPKDFIARMARGGSRG